MGPVKVIEGGRIAEGVKRGDAVEESRVGGRVTRRREVDFAEAGLAGSAEDSAEK